MSHPFCLQTDLVLRLTGGHRDGELVQIRTEKCFLGMNNENTGHPQCAIFRGPLGATLRSYSDDILINGQSKTVHWLAEGDQIQFPNSMTVEIHQLGTCTTKQVIKVESCEEGNTNVPESQLSNEISNSEIPTHEDSCVCEFATCENPGETEMQNEFEAQEKICQLESLISEIQEQNQAVHGRCNELDQRLTGLTEQISNLISLAQLGSGPAKPVRYAAPTVVESAPTLVETIQTVESVDEAAPQRESASTVLITTQENSIAAEWAQIENPAIRSDLYSESVLDSQDPEVEIVDFDEMDFEEVTYECASLMENTNETLDLKVDDMTKTTQAPKAPNKNESVTDLLARMKAEGQWNGVPDDDDDMPPVGPVSKLEDQAKPAMACTAAKDEADVEDYMSQLLSRMRGDEAPQSKLAAKKTVSAPEVTNSKSTSVSEELLTAEEFVPTQKPKKIESLSAMRELANSTARTNVNSSEESQRRALAYVQLGISVASLIMSGYYFGVLCKSVGDTGFLVGAMCLFVTGFLGFRFYSSMQSLEKLKTATNAITKEAAAE